MKGVLHDMTNVNAPTKNICWTTLLTLLVAMYLTMFRLRSSRNSCTLDFSNEKGPI